MIKVVFDKSGEGASLGMTKCLFYVFFVGVK